MASGAARQAWRSEPAMTRIDERRFATPLRTFFVTVAMGLGFVLVAGQLVRLAVTGDGSAVSTLSEPISSSFARPEIVDRNGRLLATDLEMPSLYADPSLVQSRDEVVEELGTVLADLDEAAVRRELEDRTRRFAWIRRGLPPLLAQRIHDLGLPGLAFRNELRRAYPSGHLAGHVLGSVNIDNKGIAGIERYIDEAVGVEAVHGATLSDAAPVRLSLDLGVTHSLEDELQSAVGRYEARGAAGLVIDVATGEILAAASLPGVDPSRAAEAQDPVRIDKVAGATFELGSIFKMVTIALALEGGKSLDSVIDVTRSLAAGPFTITDPHPLGRPLTVAEIFIHSSNVGAGLLALEAGAERQKAFLEKLGLLGEMRTEAGTVAAPQRPAQFGRAEQITVSYGHGLAVAPLQFAAAAAALVNGGLAVRPTLLLPRGAVRPEPARVLSAATSAKMREVLRRNVTDPSGTGRRADVPGYDVGGKTGTAELPARGGYAEKAVISSFVAAFPMSAPKYLVLVSLFEPKGTAETSGEILAGLNAAPTAARVIERIGPLLGVVPAGSVAALRE